MDPDRARAEELDKADPLGWLPDRFHRPAAGTVYLDGNSLGMLPRASVDRLHEATVAGWGERLIRGWDEGWLQLPTTVGDRLGAALLGAAAGQVVVSDSTTVNLYKLAAAALADRAGRIVTAAAEFPTDRYVLTGLAESYGRELVLLDEVTPAAVAAALAGPTALVALSHVDYRSAALADLPGITALAHGAGALVLWDLSHSVGALPVGLDAAGVDLAVGCTYKYVNAGPGAPAFLYVRAEHQARLRQPIQGWFGQRDQFRMGPAYDPAPDATRFLTGTPPVLGLSLVDSGVGVLAEAGLPAIRAKSMALGDFLIACYDARLARLGVRLGSPRDASARGAHVALSHPDGARLRRDLIRSGVIPDFRWPDQLRFGLAAPTTTYLDVWTAVDRLATLLEDASPPSGGHI